MNSTHTKELINYHYQKTREFVITSLHHKSLNQPEISQFKSKSNETTCNGKLTERASGARCDLRLMPPPFSSIKLKMTPRSYLGSLEVRGI